MTSFLCNRRSLKNAAEHLLKVNMSKAARDEMSGKSWADCVAAGKAQVMLDYAKGDVVYCHKLFTQYQNSWNPLERSLSDLTVRQCAHGIAVDVDKLRKYLAVVQTTIFKIEESMPWVMAGEKVGSPKAIAQQCRNVGIPSPPVKKREGEEAFTIWENTYGPLFPWVRLVSLHRSVNKVCKTLETILERLRPDDTIDFSLLYFGGHTGRWSGGGSGLNMQNLRKDPIYILDDYEVLLDEFAVRSYLERCNFPTASALESNRKATVYSLLEEFFKPAIRLKIDMRSIFVPRSGMQFVICDLAQIEPRVLNWLCGNQELLQRLNGGMSIYEAHARDTMGWTGGELKKENAMLYKTAKARVLGLGYGCGKDKFVVVAKTLADLDVTIEEAEKTVIDFRASNPKITGLWSTLDTAYKRSLSKDFTMDLPSGRTMTYGNVRQEVKRYQDPVTKKWTSKLVVTADVGGDREGFYGGKLCENVTQAVARDVFGEHMIALDRAGIPVLFHAHDEAITELPVGTDPREVQEIMSRTPDWLEGCPIAAEAVTASHYLK